MSAPAVQFSVLVDSGAFSALREAWNSLWERSTHRHLFSSFDWGWHAWSFVARGRGHALRLVVGKFEGRVVLIWPLMQHRRTLRMLSSETLEYRDILVERSEHIHAWIDQAWAFVATRLDADVFVLQNLRRPNSLGRKLTSLGRTTPIGGDWCPVIRLDKFGSWANYAATLPRSLVNDQRRQWKRIGRAMPGMSFRLLDRPDDITRMMDWITRQKLAWAATRENKLVWFESEDKQRLLHAVVESARRTGTLVFGVLSDGRTTVSAGWGYVTGDEFLFHVFAYDPAYATYSPSRLFLERLVQHCIDCGVRSFDFMPGEESYKRIWATDFVRTDSFAGALSTRGEWLLKVAKWRARSNSSFTDHWVKSLLPHALRRRLQARFRELLYIELAMKLKPPAPPSRGLQPSERA